MSIFSPIEVVTEAIITDESFSIINTRRYDQYNLRIVPLTYQIILKNCLVQSGKIFILKCLIENNSNLQNIFPEGEYFLLLGDDTKYQYITNTINKTIPFRHSVNTYGGLIPFTYNASDTHTYFVDNLPNKEQYNSLVKPKFSFGIEFETSGGCIPVDECIKLGLIPLRDGSIRGVEYATIPMRDFWAFSLLKRQVKTLQKYCTFDNTCSMHIHFGRYPQNIKFLYVVYRLFLFWQEQLQHILPEYTFTTEKYKQNGKSYCKLLPECQNIFDFYRFYNDTSPLNPNQKTKSLTQPHPDDMSHNRKWYVQQRYFAINLVNALFYDYNKTIEFRFLKPSFNYNYIVNWIYTFSRFLINAHGIYFKIKDCSFAEVDQILSQQDFKENLWMGLNVDSFLFGVRNLTKLQHICGDKVGLLNYHGNFFTTNLYGI